VSSCSLVQVLLIYRGTCVCIFRVEEYPEQSGSVLLRNIDKLVQTVRYHIPEDIPISISATYMFCRVLLAQAYKCVSRTVTNKRRFMNSLNLEVNRSLAAVYIASSFSWMSMGSVSQSLQICKLLMPSSRCKKIFLFTKQTSNRVIWRDKAFLWAHVYAFIVWLAVTHCLLSETALVHKVSLCIHMHQATALCPVCTKCITAVVSRLLATLSREFCQNSVFGSGVLAPKVIYTFLFQHILGKLRLRDLIPRVCRNISV
jgi:hypothetical protein